MLFFGLGLAGRVLVMRRYLQTPWRPPALPQSNFSIAELSAASKGNGASGDRDAYSSNNKITRIILINNYYQSDLR